MMARAIQDRFQRKGMGRRCLCERKTSSHLEPGFSDRPQRSTCSGVLRHRTFSSRAAGSPTSLLAGRPGFGTRPLDWGQIRVQAWLLDLPGICFDTCSMRRAVMAEGSFLEFLQIWGRVGRCGLNTDGLLWEASFGAEGVSRTPGTSRWSRG